MAAFMPGASPPDVSIAILDISSDILQIYKILVYLLHFSLGGKKKRLRQLSEPLEFIEDSTY
jgi:hypothetical protein